MDPQQNSTINIDQIYLANVAKLRQQLFVIQQAQHENGLLLQAICVKVRQLHLTLQQRHRAMEFLR